MKKSDAPASRPEWHERPLLVAVLLLAAAALAWANTWRAPFVFDDHASILENRSLRDLGSFAWLSPPHQGGETVSGRPVLNFTFALNHALGGLDVRGYHLTNLLMHWVGALALFGLVRRVPIAGRRSSGLAVAVAFAWMLHPLQTESVTYIVQRAESLMGLFCLLTLYCFARAAAPAAADVAPARFGARTWSALSVVCCLLGAGTKEVMVVVPVLVLFFDRAFFAGDLATAWRTRRGYYLALASSWLVVAGCLAMTGGDRGGTFVLSDPAAWTARWLTQFRAIATYLQLAVWPTPLVFEYEAYRVGNVTEVLPLALLVLPLVVLAAIALWRWPGWGFLGLWFFALLAPSSLLPGVDQMIVEHRLYLPLAAVIVAGAAAIRWGVHRLAAPPLVGTLAAAAIVVALGVATFQRNSDYASAIALWGDTVQKRPNNPRAHHNLGVALAQAGRLDEAREQFQRTLLLQPNHAFAHFELGKMALLAGHWSEAQDRFQAALQADPGYVDAHVNLAQALERQGRAEEAVMQLRAALALQPANDIRVSLAGLLLPLGRVGEAAPLLEQALAEPPELPEAHFYLARLRERAGDAATAERELRSALRMRPAYAAAAVALGNLVARQGRFAEAIDSFRAALAAEPEHYQARNNLANCYLALRRFPEAVAEYELILQARPNDTAVRANLSVARSMLASP